MKKRPDVSIKFKIALLIAGITQYEFAEKIDVTAAAVSQVTRGLWISGRVYSAVLSFINEHLPQDWQDHLDRKKD